MKIVSANHADSLRRPGERETIETALIDSVREELLSFFGDGDDVLPLDLAVLARKLDYTDSTCGDRAI